MTPKELFVECVWQSTEKTSTKLALLCFARHMDDDARVRTLCYATIARECSIDDSTAKRVVRAVKDHCLTVERGKGEMTRAGPLNLFSGIMPGDLVPAGP